MKILLTNDDGIYAEGLWALAGELSKIADVVIIAPDREQSGVGTSVSLDRPLRVNSMMPLVGGIETYAVEGTPGDCVLLGVNSILKDSGVNMVVAGINRGANLGHDVLVSGTVGAALHGYYSGLPSVAVSVASLRQPVWRPAAVFARHLIQKVVDLGEGAAGLLLNVNLPNITVDKIEHVDVTRVGRKSYEDVIKEEVDSRQRRFLWYSRGRAIEEAEEGTDVWALRHNRISITPLHTDLSHLLFHAAVAPWADELLGGLRADLPAPDPSAAQ
jgi:5'-nucleotidase